MPNFLPSSGPGTKRNHAVRSAQANCTDVAKAAKKAKGSSEGSVESRMETGDENNKY